MYKIFQPAIFLMNKMSYKVKISILSILSVLAFIYPIYTSFNTIILEEKYYQSQKEWLSYYSKFYALVDAISQYKQLSDKIEIEKLFVDLIEYDSASLNILSDKLEILREKSTLLVVPKYSSTIVSDLIKKFQSLSRHFSSPKDPFYDYIRMILDRQMKLLPILQEFKKNGNSIFSKSYLLPSEKVIFTKNYTQLKLLLDGYISERGILPAYFLEDIDRQRANLYLFIKVLNQNIIQKYNSGYSQLRFNQQLNTILKSEREIYRDLLSFYEDSVIKSLKNKQDEKRTFISIFISILLILLYLYVSFHQSIISRLAQLQKASWRIANGDLKAKDIFEDTKDEIGDLFLAFNQMKKNLIKNIAFLDSYKMSIDQSSIVSKTDKKGVITYVNKKFCDISGYSQEELIGKPHNIIRHPDVPKEAFKDLWNTIKSNQIWHGIVKNRKKNGDYYIVDATVAPIIDENGEVHEYIAVRHDVTELEKSKEKLRKQKEEELHLQETDLLTQLPNRVKMIKDLKNSQNSVLVFLNVSSFGKLNEFYGTDIGDKVLVILSEALQNIIKDEKIVLYKMHAAEFALVLEEEHYTKDDVEKFVLNTIKEIENKKIYCQNSNCISLSLVAGVSYGSKIFEEIFSQADIALKKAKKSNKNILFYDKSMKKESNYENNMIWIEKIKKAISEDKIVPYFQPIVDNNTEAITKYESLVRLIDDEDKVVSPFFFLDIAKGAKLYSQITKIVINKSFAVFENLSHYEFSINLSMEDVLDKDTVEFIMNKLANYTNPHRVIFEIVESEEISDYNLLTSFIQRVKSYGAKIAIDDFGTGYSNFEHILTLDADFIKIDGSLIKNIDTDENSRIITSAIIAFSKKLDKKTIVEFVHNEEVYNKVKDMGADYSQGYYLGEPKATLLRINTLKKDELLHEVEFMI
jgi:PAS domain S-box-containing protein/diguanylate cyclase (GGDEF)-like protein